MKKLKKITLHSRLYSYPVYIGYKTPLKKLSSILKTLHLGPHFVVITAPAISRLYGASLQKCFSPTVKVDQIFISDKEKDKNIDAVQKIISHLLQLRAHRKTCLVAFGGGVIGDMTGFVASIYMRGMPFIAIPTTLLSQVDSSLGGKCGVNTREGKNLVGSFYPPRAIFSDSSFLKTLPQEQYQSGLAEVIKYAIIDNQKLWNTLHTHHSQILKRVPSILEKIIVSSVLTKKKFIEQDEKDFSKRQILNFGHTIGHALEAHATYRGITHGEAIAQGMYVAADLSLQKKLCHPKTAQQIHSLLEKYGFLKQDLPTNISSYISRDKKRGTWILMKDLWKPQRVPIPPEVF
ncbi:MAG: 3-dehydroquinate synthase [Deltaproteobacteria bacterium]|nr:3-dehydroquinate synthase [Deltaproteobacteria bacterium]MBI3017382.1 3-dehydroquinate synthase [Deltaproteobacteria bacterium]